MHINYEFKAACSNIVLAENLLLTKSPVFIGIDHQVDTYFNVPNGRLKLREGNIENALIYYQRSNTAFARQSDVNLYNHKPNVQLLEILKNSLGVKVIVDKIRKIYFIDNVKFHFDQVKGLGSFLEVEAIDKDGTLGLDLLKEQCSFYSDFLQVNEKDLIAVSYSDLLLAKKSSKF